jgi:catechol 2,3-dioxygenase-like lactoylglutathione lyase family enzyme
MKPLATIPVFHVADVAASVAFYMDKLGFTEAFSYGTYRGIKRGSCEIHLTTPGDFQPRIGGGTAYVICDEVDAYFATIKAAGANPVSEPADRLYGFRDIEHDD